MGVQVGEGGGKKRKLLRIVSQKAVVFIKRRKEERKESVKLHRKANTGKSSSCRNAYAAPGTYSTHIYCNKNDIPTWWELIEFFWKG